MSKIKVIIVEDEPLAAKVLADYIAQIPFLELKGQFKDALTATEYLRDHIVDLILLDIHLPKLKGMTFIKTLSNPPAIIITSAYHQYALEGYALNVTDYLLKPIEFERFLEAVNKVWARKSKDLDDGFIRDFLLLNIDRKKVKISFTDIVYIESQREYIKVITLNKAFTSKMSIGQMEDHLPQDLFKRVHRSFIISVDKITSFDANEVEVNGISIPIGRKYKEVVPSLFR